MKNNDNLLAAIHKLEEKINMMSRAHFSLCDEIIVYITELEEKMTQCESKLARFQRDEQRAEILKVAF